MIVGCTGTYGERIEQTLKGVRALRPYVDRMVVIIDETVSKKQIKELEKAGAEVYMHPWEDSMVKMRNQYLQKLQAGDYAVCFDPDEVYDEKFCKDVRKIIAKAEENNYGMMTIGVHDETLMNDGSVSKSVSGFKKPWIFKKNLGVHYEGIGETKNVHEMPVLAPNTKIGNLPDEYFYTHYKLEWQIWERASRNVFMAGGGGNVGARNREWVRLREICKELGIENWTQARAYFRKGRIDARLRQWIIDNRFDGADYEHEMQDFFRWYQYLHPEELEGFKAEKRDARPQINVQELVDHVKALYLRIVGEEMPEEDLKQLVSAIIQGKIKKENLPRVFEDYRIQVKPKGAEKVRVAVPVDVDVRVTEDLFERALLKSKLYWTKIKPRIDLGKALEDIVWDVPKFHRWFYDQVGEMSLGKLAIYLSKHGTNTISLCIMGYHDGMYLILRTISVIEEAKKQGINPIIETHIQGDDFTEEDIAILEGYGCYVHIEPWKDDFSDYKNKLLEHANTQWILILDHDEIPTMELIKNLEEIVVKSNNAKDYNLVALHCIGGTVNALGETIHTGEKAMGKQNLHVNVKNAYEGTPHVGLKMEDYYPWKTVAVPFAYRHIKEEGTMLQRSARNVFLGGGGKNVKDENLMWVKLREITKELGVDTWKKFNDHLIRGGVGERLKNWFKGVRVFPWKDDELTHVEEYYYALHPKEQPVPNSVAMCIMTERKNLDMVKQTVKEFAYAFFETIVQGNDLTKADVKALEELGATVYVEPWNDDFGDYKNKCIGHAKSEWVLILDYDEIPSKDLIDKVPEFIDMSVGATRYNIVKFKSRDVIIIDDAEEETVNEELGKGLLHLNVSNPYYASPHIWLKPDFIWKPTESSAIYTHKKTKMKILKQSTLNFFLGGAGDNLREKNPLWVELQEVTDELGLKTWKEFDDYLKKGNVDHRILEIFDKAYEKPWHCDELQAPKLYYEKLHDKGNAK